MILENNSLIKRETFSNITEIKWGQMVDVSSRDLSKKIVTLHLSRGVDAQAIFTHVVENKSNYEAEGKFYDDGNFYFMRIWYFKNKDYASVEFIPWPTGSIIESDQYYIEQVKRNKM